MKLKDHVKNEKDLL